MGVKGTPPTLQGCLRVTRAQMGAAALPGICGWMSLHPPLRRPCPAPPQALGLLASLVPRELSKSLLQSQMGDFKSRYCPPLPSGLYGLHAFASIRAMGDHLGWSSPHTAGLQEALSERPFSLGRGKGRAQSPRPIPHFGPGPTVRLMWALELCGSLYPRDLRTL